MLFRSEAWGRPADNSASVSSISECEQRCAQLVNCKVFTYDKRAQMCHPISRADFKPNEKFDSGIRNNSDSGAQSALPATPTTQLSPAGLFTIRSNTEASGDAAGTAAYVRSRGDCEQNCARSATCKVFTYNKSVNACYLYTRADFVPNPQFDSGTKNK